MFPTITTTFGDTMYSRAMPDTSRVFTFSDLQDAIAAIDADQVDGNPDTKTLCGVPYDTVAASMIFRSEDERVAEKVVCESALKNVIGLIDKVQRSRTPNGGKVRIEWRIRPEFNVCDISVVLKYDPNGPDTDHTTDRKCLKDHNWKLAKFYARVAVMPVNE